MSPFVTIVIPALNEMNFIGQSLGAVLAQDYPAEKLQVIVADGMSVDGTREIVQSFQRKHQNLSLIDNPEKIVSTGLNAALQKAKGEIIIRVDGHCEIERDYVRRCVQHLKKHGVGGVGGFIETVGKNFVAQTIALVMSSWFGVGDSAFRTSTGESKFVDTIPFPAYKRNTIKQAGLYDEVLVCNQDDEYNYRLRRLGFKLLLADDVRSRYYSRSSLASLWKQYFNYGYWKVRVLQKHPRQMRFRQFVPPAFLAALLGLGAFTFYSSIGLILLALVGAVYLLTNLSASIIVAARHGWKHLPLLPLVYAILHFSYGLGFLIGLVRFANRWGDKKGKVPAFQSADG